MATTNYAEALNDLSDLIYDIAEEKGFWDYEDEFGQLGIVPVKLALIASEVSEALAVHRSIYDDEPVEGVEMSSLQEDDFGEELADILIRILDLASGLDLDIGSIVLDKIEKNKDRPRRHNKRY